MGFVWHIYIWLWSILKVMVKVMSCSTMNIFEIVTYRAKLLLPTNSKSFMGLWLAYLHLTLAHSKGQGKDHANFHNGYLGKWWEIGRKLQLPLNSKSCMCFWLAFDLDLIWSSRQCYVPNDWNGALFIGSSQLFSLKSKRLCNLLFVYIRTTSITLTVSGLFYYQKVHKWNFKNSSFV